MRRMRRVKIVATLGPASNDEATIEKLARAGADVFRINMSHASHDLLKQTVQRIRSVEHRIQHPIGILADLQGPKLRVGTFEHDKVRMYICLRVSRRRVFVCMCGPIALTVSLESLIIAFTNKHTPHHPPPTPNR